MSLFGWKVLKRPLPWNISLSESPEQTSKTLLVGFFKPNSIFLTRGGEDGFVRQLLFFCNDSPDLERLIFRVVNPVSNQSFEEILAHPFGGMRVQGVHHIEEILCHFRALAVVHHIDTDLHLFPKGNMTFLPDLRSRVIHQWSVV